MRLQNCFACVRSSPQASDVETPVPTLVFLCPRTRKAIDAGMAVDDRSRKTLFENPVTVACPYCGGGHEFRMRQSYLSGEAV
jgi:hypothetical protein